MTVASTCFFWHLLVLKAGKWEPRDCDLTASPYFSPALQSVARLSDVGRIVTATVRLAAQRYAAGQPEIPPPWQHSVRADEGERSRFCSLVVSPLLLLSLIVAFTSAGRRAFSQTEIGFCVSDGREAPGGPQNYPAEKVEDSGPPEKP